MNAVNRLMRIVRTIRYLKARQLIFQAYYRLTKPRIRKSFNAIAVPRQASAAATSIRLQEFPVPIHVKGSVDFPPGCFRFEFLHLPHAFKKEIDWNFGGLGKLWTYNLNYFEFLFSGNCDPATGTTLIREFASRLPVIRDGLEPYPVSLRNINWIKFFARHGTGTDLVDEAIDLQYKHLFRNLEYHLMGNHLLENGFSLLFGGYYLRNETYYGTGKEIVLKELDRQILPDGGHFEQSPMYHQIILYRLLDSINLINNNQVYLDADLSRRLKTHASRMLGWLKKMSFSGGSIPCFNDAAPCIAPDTGQLLWYADSLNIIPDSTIRLEESGFRMWKKDGMECCLDIGSVAAAYQPGHTHADTFSFCLNAGGKPVIVDTGISTYEKNARRQYERSTAAHNTVVVNKQDSSEVWGGFRLGKRARVQITREDPWKVTARHDGYSAEGCIHERTFEWNTAELLIKDKLIWNGKGSKALSLLHFHPDRAIRIENNRILIDDRMVAEAKGYDRIFSEEYQFSKGYNRLVPSQRVAGVLGSEATWSIRPL